MRYLSLFFLAIIVNFSSFAGAPSIVAIVNNTPITLKEFMDRRQFLQFVNNIEELTLEAEIHINRTALKTLIDEQLFINESKKFKMDITDNEISQAIYKIEKTNNMPKGQFIENLKANSINIETLKRQIKAQIIKEKLAYEFSHTIDVNRNEVKTEAGLANKDVKAMSEDEYDYIANSLANKKISIQVQKYYEKLKRKAYIKIFLQ
ncbi:MAG: hypothetical protein K0Q51_1083 [Rickettsiaceae bacterium]|jgi:parvulin-like peptidyl-prolyl isomerase|nr:hypothetical protein [Rickettsiaceae bacterium]